MNFEMPMATSAMNNKVAAAGDGDGEVWDVIGDPLNDGVNRTVPAYGDKFQLDLRPTPADKRLEISELRWGRIEKDAGRLEGLAAAMENIAQVIKKGKDQLAHDWKGESFEAFKTAVEVVEQTLNDHAGAATATATGFREIVNSIKTMYDNYQSTSTGIFAFDGIPRPDDLVKVDEAKCAELDWAFFPDRAGPARDRIRGLAITKSREEWFWHENGLFEVWDDAGVIQSESQALEDSVAGKINEWYVATDGVREGVTELYDAALENLRLMAELKVFSTMQVPGADAAAGDTGGNGDTGGGDTGGGGNTGGGNTGGGNSGGGSGYTPPPPPPMPEMPEMPEPDAAVTDPSAMEPGADTALGGSESQGQPETVTITEGDREIAVQSPDGEGRVKVTVDDGSGEPKSYELDFGAGTQPGTGLPGAPGTGPGDAPTPGTPGTPGAEFGPEGSAGGGGVPEESHEVIRAGEDGKAVISDPPMTITAEHEPGADGAGGTVLVTVDDGSGAEPTQYTLDFSEGTAAQDATPSGVGPMPAAEARPAFAAAEQQELGTMPAAGERPEFAAAERAEFGTMPAAEERPGFVEPGAGERPQVGAMPAAEDRPTWAEPGTAQQVSPDAGATHASMSGPIGAGLDGGAGDGPAPESAMGAESGSATAESSAALSEAVAASRGDDGGGHSSSGAMGSGMMGGGMGGAAGGQGGDSERSSGMWRTSGNLFDDDLAGVQGRFDSTIGEAPSNQAR